MRYKFVEATILGNKYKASIIFINQAFNNGKILETKAFDVMVVDGTVYEENCVVFCRDAYAQKKCEATVYNYTSESREKWVDRNGEPWEVCETTHPLYRPCKIWYNVYQTSLSLQEYLDKVFS